MPGFYTGAVSVQDAGAQLAAILLSPQPGERVLDACAAPGGKTAHLLELAHCEMVALELDGDRLSKIGGNLDRLRLHSDKVQCCGEMLQRHLGGTATLSTKSYSMRHVPPQALWPDTQISPF